MSPLSDRAPKNNADFDKMNGTDWGEVLEPFNRLKQILKSRMREICSYGSVWVLPLTRLKGWR